MCVHFHVGFSLNIMSMRPIHTFVCVDNPLQYWGVFHFMNRNNRIVYSPVGGHMSYFPFLTILRKATMDILMYIFAYTCTHKIDTSLDLNTSYLSKYMPLFMLNLHAHLWVMMT